MRTAANDSRRKGVGYNENHVCFSRTKIKDKAQILEIPVSAKKSEKENFPDRLASLRGSSSLLEFEPAKMNFE